MRLSSPSGPTEHAVAVFLCGLALFTPPLLAVFAQGGTVAGVPLLYVYLFGGWALVIALTAWVMERAPHDDPADAAPAEGE